MTVNHGSYSAGLGRGVYGLFKTGHIFSHSVASDSDQQIELKFKEGDLVSVELDPSAGKVTYSKGGASLSQITSFRSITKEAVNFCVMLLNGNSQVSIV